jgi:hypothetical protein
MLELQFLALLNMLNNWGTAPVIATQTVAADAPMIHALLSDPANERHLAAGIAPLRRAHVTMSPKAGRLYRRATVKLGGRDVLRVTWLFAPGRGTTDIDLTVQTESDSVLVRLAWLAARHRLRPRLEAALSGLAEAARLAAESVEPEPPAAPAVPVVSAPAPLETRSLTITSPRRRSGTTFARHGQRRLRA